MIYIYIDITYIQNQLPDMKNPSLPNQPNQSTPNQNPIISCLQILNKSKANSQQSLQQQLQQLSMSYKNAQQKILSIQKQIYYQNIYNQKQRSIIQILKYIINGNLDDQTILSYLVSIQKEQNTELENRYEIKKQLQQIKQLVIRQKTNNKKQQSINKIVVNDLKKQINKSNYIKKQLIQDLDRILNQKGVLQNCIQQAKYQIQTQFLKLMEYQRKINQLIQSNNYMCQEKQNLKIQIAACQSKNREDQQIMKKIREQIQNLLKNEGNKIQHSTDLITLLKKVQQKLQKYRNLGKQITQKLKKNSQSIQLMSTLKLFLPEQALKICQQFECKGQKCYLTQIQGIAKLQIKKIEQLQKCQQQVWRLKSKLLIEGQNWTKSGKIWSTNSIINKENSDHNFKNQGEITEFTEKQ